MSPFLERDEVGQEKADTSPRWYRMSLNARFKMLRILWTEAKYSPHLQQAGWARLTHKLSRRSGVQSLSGMTIRVVWRGICELYKANDWWDDSTSCHSQYASILNTDNCMIHLNGCWPLVCLLHWSHWWELRLWCFRFIGSEPLEVIVSPRWMVLSEFQLSVLH